jgi:death-on-curing protein
LPEGKPFVGIGPRDLGLLQSAVARQSTEYGGVRRWTSTYDQCATLFFGLIKDHPFYDANKRTAFLILLYHLQKFKLVPSVSQKDLEDFAVAVADNKLDNYARFQSMLDFHGHRHDADLAFISDYLKRNTRSLDHKHYSVTYREMATILKKFNLEFDNPYKNYIDVIRYEKKRKFFGGQTTVKRKIVQIGFPGWSKQIGAGAIKSLRKAAKLTPEDGVDSATFFRDAQRIDCLIHEYQAPLKRLAHR